MKYRYPAKDFLSCSFPPIDLVAHIDRRKEIPPQIAASNKKSRQEMRVRFRCAGDLILMASVSGREEAFPLHFAPHKAKESK